MKGGEAMTSNQEHSFDEGASMKQDVNPISTAYQSYDRAAGLDKLALHIVHELDRETQLLNPHVARRLGNIREAALRLHDQSVSMDVNASPVARVPGNRERCLTK
jgi:hypothetical protein